MDLVGKYFHIIVSDENNFHYAEVEGVVEAEVKDGVYAVKWYCWADGTWLPDRRLITIEDMCSATCFGVGWVFYDTKAEMDSAYSKRYALKPNAVNLNRRDLV